MTATAGTGLPWEPDRLLAGFEAATLPTGGPLPAARNGILALVPPLPHRAASAATDRDAHPGAVTVPEPAPAPVATLVRRAHGMGTGEAGFSDGGPRGVFLHVHGYNDYFFQEHLARAVEDAGFAFFAVDLRAAGRSLRPGQVPHFVEDLRESATDLSVAVAAVRGLHPGLPVVVHAHSTGGLVAPLWAHAHRRQRLIDALVLDSPFLDLNSSWLNRTIATRVLDAVGPWSPLAVLSAAPSAYAAHLLASNGGRWEFDPTLKRPEGLPVRAGWLRAVRQGQARLARGLDVSCPVLVAHSASSGPDDLDNPLLDSQDTVLDVAQIERLAPRVGVDVTVRAIEGGVHDLTLSTDGPRLAYLDGVLDWLGDRVGQGEGHAAGASR
ncbi:alpha/beta fold hydrolase [Oerskovia paurometabola]|uniref:Alpha/beta fold hydrolase n=1 Tax=Oerskovia paurometabola TaxID=162170 RepID=A0ABW1XG80_9CELL|nr:alpha/beta hydrolase [Oerskovia paurometabola]MBM7497479.1 alpha-beta hydrolase superfamily lysophospholipase [Oerskovia paurometabola]